MTKFGNNDLITARIKVTAAQLFLINNTPLSVLGAPGKNKALLIDTIHVQTAPGSVNFAGGGVVSFVYHGGSVSPHAGNLPAATITSATPTNNLLAPVAAVIQVPVNTGLDITNATAAFSAGNGVVILTIWYSVQTLG